MVDAITMAQRDLHQNTAEVKGKAEAKDVE